MWWLRNQALPRTQAFFALVMWLFSTVNSMSSQTQPQKVQVALLTILSSVADTVGPFRSTFGRGWDIKVATDFSDEGSARRTPSLHEEASTERTRTLRRIGSTR